MVGNHHGKHGPGPKNPRRSAERRAGLRHWPVISGDPEMGPTARRTTGAAYPHQRFPALRSPHFWRARKG